MTKQLYYVMDEDGTIRETEDVSAWSRSFESSTRLLAQTNICAPGNLTKCEAFVSTVFLGINHAFAGGPPILFETLIELEGESGDVVDRYQTKKDALLNHEIYVAAVRKVLEDATEPRTLERVKELVLEEAQPTKYGQPG